MSATNRSKSGGDGVDFFETPAWCVDLLLERVPLPDGEWLEPSAGNGAIIRAVRRLRPGQVFGAVESDPRRWKGLRALDVALRPLDFLVLMPPQRGRWDLCIGNPPYTQAEAFVRKGLTLAREVVYLLRLGFLAGQKRAALYREHGTPDVYVLPRRPSFTGRGTDSADYAWMRWTADRSQEGRVVRLETTRGAT